MSLGRYLRAVRNLLVGDRLQRRRVRHELARLAAGLFGDFPIFEDHKLWRQDSRFLADYARLSPGNPFSQDRKYVLREMARFTRGIPGAMAECGSFQGASAFFLAREAPEATLHLFDSLEGLPPAREEDVVEEWGGSYWSEGGFAIDDSALHRNLAEFDNVVIHKGWIPERFPEVADETFRLVHIDVDLYQPTLDSLEFFYPRTAPGGVLVLDDYGFRTCPGAYRAVEEYMSERPEHVIHLPTGQGLVIRAAPQSAPTPPSAKNPATDSTT